MSDTSSVNPFEGIIASQSPANEVLSSTSQLLDCSRESLISGEQSVPQIDMASLRDVIVEEMKKVSNLILLLT